MKRFLTLVLMLCVGLCAGCAQNQQPDPQKPENGTLTAEELEEFQAMFTPGSWYSQATTSSYTSPKDIDLHRLFYDGIGFSGLPYGHTYLTDRERAYLTSLDPESVMQYFRAPPAGDGRRAEGVFRRVSGGNQSGGAVQIHLLGGDR